jgi:hypothetical protein
VTTIQTVLTITGKLGMNGITGTDMHTTTVDIDTGIVGIGTGIIEMTVGVIAIL